MLRLVRSAPSLAQQVLTHRGKFIKLIAVAGFDITVGDQIHQVGQFAGSQARAAVARDVERIEIC
jgi:hypothetical protein